MKAKVDQLNLVFVILKLVLVAGKLYLWRGMCLCVSSASFNSVCFYSRHFSPLEAHLGLFVVSDVGI